MTHNWMWMTLNLLGCGDKNTDSATETTELRASVTLTSLNDRPQIEIGIRSNANNEEVFTEEDGTASLPLMPNSPFVLTAVENDSLQHRYVGNTTDRNFALDALFLDRGSWLSLLGNVGLSEQTGTGHLWVNVVNPNFLPIANASVTVDGNPSDAPFILLNTNVPWSTNSIDPEGRSTVFFPNIAPQDVTINVTLPSEDDEQGNPQSCRLFVDDSVENTATATIYANTATILWFICR